MVPSQAATHGKNLQIKKASLHTNLTTTRPFRVKEQQDAHLLCRLSSSPSPRPASLLVVLLADSLVERSDEPTSELQHDPLLVEEQP